MSKSSLWHRFGEDERGQSLTELALSLLFFVAFLVVTAVLIECAHMKIVTEQALRVAARAAVVSSHNADGDVVAAALAVFEQNPPILPTTARANPEHVLRSNIHIQDVHIGSGLGSILRRVNVSCTITITFWVPIPFVSPDVEGITGNTLMIPITSSCVVNRWNAGVLFYVPIKEN